jgi:hypothetical protein
VWVSQRLKSLRRIRVRNCGFSESDFFVVCEDIWITICPFFVVVIQYCENVKSAWETFCGVHEAKTIENKLFFRRRFFTIKMQEGEDLLAHINMVKALADQLRSIEVKIEDEDVYMVLLMSLPPSFDNLVTSLESMFTKDVDLQFIVARLLNKVSKRKESENTEICYIP